MTAPDQILDILRKAYQIEVDGYTFYSMTADRADKPAVQELFGKLAQDEVQHQAFLRSVLKNYHDKGVDAFAMGIVLPDFRAFSDKVFTDRFREQAEGAAFEMAALSVGMTLEKNAVAYFSGAAKSADGGGGPDVLPVPRRLGTAAPERARRRSPRPSAATSGRRAGSRRTDGISGSAAQRLRLAGARAAGSATAASRT